jgi:ABC-type multidrug transport system fused ATPase/permease subunit
MRGCLLLEPSTRSALNVVQKLFALLERRDRIQLFSLGVAMIVVAVVETVGVASILPFMQLVVDPSVVERPGTLSMVYDRLGFASPESFLFAVGVGVLLLIAFNNGVNAVTVWFMHRFTAAQNHRLSMRLLGEYLNQPYSWFLDRNTAHLNRTLLSEVGAVISQVMLPALKVVARGFTVVLIVLLLAVVDPKLAGTIALVFGGAYAIVYGLMRRVQYRLGQERFAQNGLRYSVSNEALSGIKAVKAMGREPEFLRRFGDPSWRYAMTSAKNQVMARLPRYILETVAFGGVLVIVLFYLRRGSDLSGILPVLSLYVFAGYRVLPALNELFSSVVSIRFGSAAVEELSRDLVNKAPPGHSRITERTQDTGESLPLEQELVLDDVGFTYPDASGPTLDGLQLTIPAKQMVGFVGQTGSGKTTLVDLGLGLLAPTEGSIRVDGNLLDGTRVRAWRAECGYVPQDIFLSDDTIAANIAFGLPAREVDRDAVEQAARIAQIHEFVVGLPAGYETVVGERGVRLSGGQRQRIGIARALYRDPSVLVLDEATSALDGATESALIETINRLVRRKTILVIAHRLSTVRNCDVIYLLENGRVVASGAYDALYRESSRFQAMVGEPES